MRSHLTRMRVGNILDNARENTWGLHRCSVSSGTKHFSTKPDQSTCADVVVIGAGVIGTSLALNLGRRGHRVTVLDALSVLWVLHPTKIEDLLQTGYYLVCTTISCIELVLGIATISPEWQYVFMYWAVCLAVQSSPEF